MSYTTLLFLIALASVAVGYTIGKRYPMSRKVSIAAISLWGFGLLCALLAIVLLPFSD